MQASMIASWKQCHASGTVRVSKSVDNGASESNTHFLLHWICEKKAALSV
jgi:hypothetical protein